MQAQHLSRGQQLLEDGRKRLEDGNIMGAVNCFVAAYQACDFDGDHAGVVHSLIEETSAWQHMAKSAGDFNKRRAYALRALSMAQLADRLCTIYGEEAKAEYPQAQFRLGTAYMINERYDAAVAAFKQAYAYFQQGWEPQRWDWKAHYGEANYLAGARVLGERMMIEAFFRLSEFRGKEPDGKRVFQLDVWSSGVALALARCLWEEERDKSLNWLAEAMRIAENGENLILRKKEIARFTQERGL